MGVERDAFRDARRTERVTATPCSSAGPTASCMVGDDGRVIGVWECGGKGAVFVLDLALLVNEVGVAFQTLGNGRGKMVAGRLVAFVDETVSGDLGCLREIRCLSNAPSQYGMKTCGFRGR